MFHFLQDHEESLGRFATARTGDANTGRSTFPVLREHRSRNGVASDSVFGRVDPDGARRGDEGEEDSDQDKHREEPLVDDAGLVTDIEYDELDKTRYQQMRVLGGREADSNLVWRGGKKGTHPLQLINMPIAPLSLVV